ncbi:MAG: DUF2804 domain-containing protein, partial [Acholeplasmataceae bacterium]|nr:DUF2804 domain-containing protein [Acholeplasmataceae bacterium]
NSYMGLGSVSFLDFKNADFITKSVMTLFPMGKTNLPRTSVSGDVSFMKPKLQIEFLNDGKVRHLKGMMKKFRGEEEIHFDVTLIDVPQDSMVIATPFFKKHHFYYNQKINCLRAKGEFSIGSEIYTFEPDTAFGVLDWGRGVWTYKNTWYWSSLSSVVDGIRVGFNLGYGFGNTEAASENMLFYDGVAYKLKQVVFAIPQDEKGNYQYLKPWKITSDDKSLNLTFEPILDRFDDTSALIIRSCQHQVFGKFSGTMTFKDKVLEIKDLVGFAERVQNRW